MCAGLVWAEMSAMLGSCRDLLAGLRSFSRSSSDLGGADRVLGKAGYCKRRLRDKGPSRRQLRLSPEPVCSTRAPSANGGFKECLGQQVGLLPQALTNRVRWLHLGFRRVSSPLSLLSRPLGQHASPEQMANPIQMRSCHRGRQTDKHRLDAFL